MTRLLRRAARFLAVFASLFLSAEAMATFPDKPVTLLVPFPAGGASDMIARTIGARLQEQWKQTVLVDNKPGATGTIAAAQFKRAAPDGYTILVSSLGPFVIAPHLYKSQSYDALKDLDLIMVAVQSPNVLVVPANSKLKSLADVLAELKTHPDTLSFSSSGNGSSDHLTAELFWQQTGTSGLHVPYKGGAPAVQDLIGGQVAASFQNVNSVFTQIQSGKLRALAVTGSKRSLVLPQVATLSELGVKGVDVYSWQGVAVPAGMAPALKAQIHAALVTALSDPATQKKLTDIGLEMVVDTPDHARAFQAVEFARWKSLIEARKITAD
ncbi:MAG: tripartite tricarboxylate transporter substrate binding protein [Paucibacter sp.]|nr:tripartite tricarboxylate transporter substrate binding protein [Roseateles sp.]